MIIKRIFLSGLMALLFGIVFGQSNTLMPVPEKIIEERGEFELTENFQVAISGPESRIQAATRSFLARLSDRTRTTINRNISEDCENCLKINVQRKGELKLGEDESYRLQISPTSIVINAETDFGAMHGLETLLQLISYNSPDYQFEAITIEDTPRFPWRGLLIDVCRHWQPIEVIKRNLDGMAAMKMNVLHLHLTEDQGFRIESRLYPELAEKGSNGNYFTQEQIKEIIAYADARGIRVIPEFDMPGHATSWFVSHPEIASKQMDYQIEKKFGVMDPAMDPTNEKTYEFLDAFLSEMCSLFPDKYFHIGGDENNGKHWDANPDIQKWMKENNIKDNHELQAYFNKRLLKILQKNGKRMVGWDEILQPDIPNDIVIQSWRGKEAMVDAAKKGYQVMLSNGYYIDLCKPAKDHYLNDPLPADIDLSEDEKKFVVGGEATMWAELVSPETIDSRIWPRTCAIAERLWSPQNVNDVKDMYRRMEINSIRMEELGLQHIRYQEMLLRRHFGDIGFEKMLELIALIEPLKIYNRHHQGIQYSTDLPLTRLPDIALPESEQARHFGDYVDDFLFNGERQKSSLFINSYLISWVILADEFSWFEFEIKNMRSLMTFSEDLGKMAKIGSEAMEILSSEKPSKDADWYSESKKIIEKAAQPKDESTLAIIPHIEKLVEAASKIKK